MTLYRHRRLKATSLIILLAMNFIHMDSVVGQTIFDWSFDGEERPFIDNVLGVLAKPSVSQQVSLLRGAVRLDNTHLVEDNNVAFLLVKDHPGLTGHTNNENGLQSLTIEVDIQLTSLKQKATVVNNLDNKGFGYEVFVNQDGRVGFEIRGLNGSGMLTSKNCITADSQWHRIVATWEGSRDVYNFQVILDGVVSWATRNIDVLRDTESDLLIGAKRKADKQIVECLDGWLDNLKISHNRLDLLEVSGVIDYSLVKASGQHLHQQPGFIASRFVGHVQPTPECHAGTLAQSKSGDIVAAWFGGTREGHTDVAIWGSRFNQTDWDKPTKMVTNEVVLDPKNPYTSMFNPALFQYPEDGPMLLFYKVGPLESARHNMLSSFDGGYTWTTAGLSHLIQGGIGKNKPVLLDDGTLICPNGKGSQVKFDFTRDFGRTWGAYSLVPDQREFGAIHPTILKYKNGRLQMLARTRAGNMVTSWSVDGGVSWTPLEKTDLPQNFSGFDAVTLSDGRHLVVYNHVSMEKGEWGGPRTPLNVAVTEDGVNWYAAVVLEDESGEYSYPAVIQAADGIVHVIYTWNRLRMKHVELDPEAFVLRPIVDGKWL